MSAIGLGRDERQGKLGAGAIGVQKSSSFIEPEGPNIRGTRNKSKCALSSL